MGNQQKMAEKNGRRGELAHNRWHIFASRDYNQQTTNIKKSALENPKVCQWLEFMVMLSSYYCLKHRSCCLQDDEIGSSDLAAHQSSVNNKSKFVLSTFQQMSKVKKSEWGNVNKEAMCSDLVSRWHVLIGWSLATRWQKWCYHDHCMRCLIRGQMYIQERMRGPEKYTEKTNPVHLFACNINYEQMKQVMNEVLKTCQFWLILATIQWAEHT